MKLSTLAILAFSLLLLASLIANFATGKTKSTIGPASATDDKIPNYIVDELKQIKALLKENRAGPGMDELRQVKAELMQINTKLSTNKLKQTMAQSMEPPLDKLSVDLGGIVSRLNQKLGGIQSLVENVESMTKNAAKGKKGHGIDDDNAPVVKPTVIRSVTREKVMSYHDLHTTSPGKNGRKFVDAEGLEELGPGGIKWVKAADYQRRKNKEKATLDMDIDGSLGAAFRKKADENGGRLVILVSGVSQLSHLGLHLHSVEFNAPHLLQLYIIVCLDQRILAVCNDLGYVACVYDPVLHWSGLSELEILRVTGWKNKSDPRAVWGGPKKILDENGEFIKWQEGTPSIYAVAVWRRPELIAIALAAGVKQVTATDIDTFILKDHITHQFESGNDVMMTPSRCMDDKPTCMFGKGEDYRKGWTKYANTGNMYASAAAFKLFHHFASMKVKTSHDFTEQLTWDAANLACSPLAEKLKVEYLKSWQYPNSAGDCDFEQIWADPKLYCEVKQFHSVSCGTGLDKMLCIGSFLGMMVNSAPTECQQRANLTKMGPVNDTFLFDKHPGARISYSKSYIDEADKFKRKLFREGYDKQQYGKYKLSSLRHS